MPNTGVKPATTGADDASTGAIAWTNPGNITASDNVYATAPFAGIQFSHLLVSGGHNAGVPAGAQITGIVVTIERSESAGFIIDAAVQLYANGARIGVSKQNAAEYALADEVITYGAANDMWGYALTADIVNAAGFGVALQARKTNAGAGTASIDQITLTVYYFIADRTLSAEIWTPGAGGVRTSSGPLFEIDSLEITDTIDGVGQFKMTIPPMDVRVPFLTQGTELHFQRAGEGEIFRGIIEGRKWVLTGTQMMLEVTGPSIMQELGYLSTLHDREFNNRTSAQWLTGDANALLAGTGWGTNIVAAGLPNLTARFDGVSRLNALLSASKIHNMHVRQNGVARSIDYGAFGAASGVTLVNAESVGQAIDQNALAAIIEAITVTEEGATIVNSIIPVGAGQGANQFALGNSKGSYVTQGQVSGTFTSAPDATHGTDTVQPWVAAGVSPAGGKIRSGANSANIISVAGSTLTLDGWTPGTPGNGAAYTLGNPLVLSAAGPSGKTYYYLEDWNSIASYGKRQKTLAASHIAPIANSVSAYQLAANALWLLSRTYLQRYAQPNTIYDVTVESLTPASFKVGDNLTIKYRGVAEDSLTSRRSWLNVNAAVICMQRTRAFARDGSYKWKLKLSTLARWREDAATLVIGAIEQLNVMKTAVTHYTMSVSHGSERESIVTAHPFDYSIVYDSNVAQLLKCSLQVKFKVLKSNVTATVSEASHTHSVTGATSAASAGTNYKVPSDVHTHRALTYNSASPQAYSGYDLYTDGNGSGNILSLSTSARQNMNTNATGAWATGNVSDISHTHSVSGQTASAGTSHTHALTYGIFEASSPATFTSLSVFVNGVDRSAALGGPWNAGTVLTLDISAYLIDAAGHPLRQENIVQFQTAGATAYDIIAHANSVLTASAIEAV